MQITVDGSFKALPYSRLYFYLVYTYWYIAAYTVLPQNIWPTASIRVRRHETATSTFGGNITSDRTGHPLSNGLFTPPTRTRQKCLVLSCLVANIILLSPATRQFCLVSTQFPISVASYLDPVSMSFVSSQCSFQFATNSLFTPPTRTRQNCLVVSVLAV